MSTPIYDQLDAEHESTVVIPDDAHVWTDDDHLTVADAPAVNGTADQAGGLTL
ncbi:hypothetical protein [Curtobacterium sp. MCSS17_015]|uniref:hypothetical protein n=1 Tax=Curtobacterium sp. MCSS17_015 TaxID=2175666 RepID=UPI0015E89A27|nr:hypothetical protein [Curtobacterium sp. MCSS17_015]WIB25438.1 hypothetical protein DEJ18_10250 [Curtobacterium sp. MCSS17_015]